MTEMTWTTVHIGGALPKNRVDELQEAIDEDFSEQAGDTIEAAVAGNISLCVQGHVNYGNPDWVRGFCQLYGLPYWRHWGPKDGQFDSGILIWKPGMEDEVGCDASSEGYEPVLSLQELVVRLDAGETLAAAVEHLGKFSADHVPPLTLGPDADDDGEPEEIPLPEVFAHPVPISERLYVE